MNTIAVNTNRPKIFLLLTQNELKIEISELLTVRQFELADADGEIDDILTQIHHFMPDIILIDTALDNAEFLIRQIRSVSKNQNAQMILIPQHTLPFDVMNMAQGYVELPLNHDILLCVINSHLKIKKSLDRLYENNKELSRSLYQLNVLYNTSSQFAGTLNTDKLCEIMIEAMEKTLSFDISSVIMFNTNKKPVFKLNTIHTPTQNLIDALKIRSILNYELLFEDKTEFNSKTFENIEIIQKIKQERSNKVFGLESVSFDSLFAPIKVGDEIFGVVELFRQNPFLAEDVTCFQAIAHQVALPLRSAKLYEEISTTNKKLEKLEKIKSEFISIVSHELRTPITPIVNSLDIVLNGYAGEISDEARNFISMAKRNFQRFKGIVEDLLLSSRIEAGNLDCKYIPADITPCLELLKNTFIQVASEKNIAINLNIQDKIPEIYADTRRIEQIFTNLVSNSIKFTSENGKIDITTNIVDAGEINYDKLICPIVRPEGKYVKVSVKDNGIGMREEDIPKIFDKFSQIESSLNRNKGGVGLGLSITKNLIDYHLGVIEVNSKEKEGSDFCVYLPLVDDKKIFQMNLAQKVTNSDSVGLIKVSYKNKFDLTAKLKEQKLIINAPSSRELFVLKDDTVYYYFYTPDISADSFSAFCTNIKNYINGINSEENDIILLGYHSAKDLGKIKELISDL